jgi:hypothetical protein
MSQRSIGRREVLKRGLQAGCVSLLPASAPAFAGAPDEGRRPDPSSRSAWLAWVVRVSRPVLDALQSRSLHATMPVETQQGFEAQRRVGTHLEAMARLLAGLAPWLELPEDGACPAEEEAVRVRFRKAAQAAIRSAVDPASPDAMHFGESAQTLVDSSFLSLALLRAPRTLLGTLDDHSRELLLRALERERAILPPFSNWLLFAALNEAMIRRLGGAWDRVRVEYALRELEAWYLGDGVYGDGPQFHFDFYNSYVIHPYLLALVDELRSEAFVERYREAVFARAARYAVEQERLIGPDGAFPAIGRSITYRAGAFHLLAEMSRRDLLPHSLAVGGVRAGLSAVQQRTLDAAETFTPEGWLQIGLAGHQPSLGESYISTGSLYLCSAVWLPLGLPATHRFWTEPASEWSQKKIWSGGDLAADHALDEQSRPARGSG